MDTHSEPLAPSGLDAVDHVGNSKNKTMIATRARSRRPSSTRIRNNPSKGRPRGSSDVKRQNSSDAKAQLDDEYRNLIVEEPMGVDASEADNKLEPGDLASVSDGSDMAYETPTAPRYSDVIIESALYGYAPDAVPATKAVIPFVRSAMIKKASSIHPWTLPMPAAYNHFETLEDTNGELSNDHSVELPSLSTSKTSSRKIPAISSLLKPLVTLNSTVLNASKEIETLMIHSLDYMQDSLEVFDRLVERFGLRWDAVVAVIPNPVQARRHLCVHLRISDRNTLQRRHYFYIGASNLWGEPVIRERNYLGIQPRRLWSEEELYWAVSWEKFKAMGGQMLGPFKGRSQTWIADRLLTRLRQKHGTY